MKILVLEQDSGQIENLVNRIEEAAKRTLLKGISVTGGTLREAGAFVPDLIFTGQFAVDDLDDILKRLNGIFPGVPIALVLSGESYISDSIDIRRSFPVRILAQGDIPQIAQMILDLNHGTLKGPSVHKGRVVSVAHSRGGVGASTFAVSCADGISGSGKSVALVDLSIMNPDITRWASYDIVRQTALRKFFLDDRKSNVQIEEFVKTVPFANPNLSVIGQLESFVVSFKMHVDSPDSGISTFECMERLVEKLTEDFEFVVLDLGNTWGVSSLSGLALSTHVFFVIEGTQQNMIRSLENLKRFAAESEDPSEFDFRKWAVVVNGVDSVKQARSLYRESQEKSILGDKIPVWGLPASTKGADWSVSNYTMYGAGDKSYSSGINEIMKESFPDIVNVV